MVNRANFIDRQVGGRVRSLRDAASVSMQYAASLIGSTLEDYRKLEAGEKRFHARQLIALVEDFGVPLSEIFDKIEIPGTDRLHSPIVEPVVAVLH